VDTLLHRNVVARPEKIAEKLTDAVTATSARRKMDDRTSASYPTCELNSPLVYMNDSIASEQQSLPTAKSTTATPARFPRSGVEHSSYDVAENPLDRLIEDKDTRIVVEQFTDEMEYAERGHGTPQ
jgi:hypothetical protein